MGRLVHGFRCGIAYNEKGEGLYLRRSRPVLEDGPFCGL